MAQVAESAPDMISKPSLNRSGNRRGLSRASQANLRRGNRWAAVAEDPSLASTEEDGGSMQLLKDMRHAYARPPSEDRTQGQRTCRKWKRTDLPRFMSCKIRLESELLTAGGSPEDYVRIEFDERRDDPSFDQDFTVSLLVKVEPTNELLEFLFTVDEVVQWQSLARAAGLSLWEVIKKTLDEAVDERRGSPQ